MRTSPALSGAAEIRCDSGITAARSDSAGHSCRQIASHLFEADPVHIHVGEIVALFSIEQDLIGMSRFEVYRLSHGKLDEVGILIGACAYAAYGIGHVDSGGIGDDVGELLFVSRLSLLSAVPLAVSFTER